jgi:protein tyrosine phosphatase (PTP) superfamily phosphohydrolase (DUF442 family)
MDEPGYTRMTNFRRVNDSLITGGQPTVAQLQRLAEAGFATVINLALHDNPRYSLPDEPGTVASLGLQYVHIPVQFEAPTEADLLAFFAAMEAHQGERILVHCAANMRVSAFLGLFWTLRQGWTPDRAFQLMRGLWAPNEVWARYIATMLAKHGADSATNS